MCLKFLRPPEIGFRISQGSQSVDERARAHPPAAPVPAAGGVDDRGTDGKRPRFRRFGLLFRYGKQFR